MGYSLHCSLPPWRLLSISSPLASLAALPWFVTRFFWRGGQGAGGGGGGGGGGVMSCGGGSVGVGGAPHAAPSDSPAAAGGGDAWGRQKSAGLPTTGAGVAACLGASVAEVPIASVGTCVDTSPGAAPEDASLSFTLEFGASHSFFRDHTTLTPLPALRDQSLLATLLRFCVRLFPRGPASRPGPERESFFLVVFDAYSRYTTAFPLAKKSEVTSTLVRWLLTTADTRGRCVSCLHSDRGGEFRSGVLAGFCREQGIRQSWTPLESPQQNGVAERRIGLVMDIARLLWLHILPPSPSRPFDESVPYYTRYPCRGLLVPPPPLFLTPTPPPAPQVQPPPSGPAPSGVSHATPPPPVAPQVSFPSPESSSQSPQQPSTLPPQATADPEGAGVRSADPGAEPESAGSSSLQGAGVSRTVPGGATTGNAMSGGTGAPPTGPGESGTGRVAAGGAGSGGGATGALESGPGVTTAPDTTPLPHPYPTRHQARVRCAPRGERVGAEAAGATAAGGTAGATAAAAAVAGGAAVAGAATAAATAARAAAAAAAGGATVVAAAGATAASTSSSCFWSSGPRSPLSLSSLLLLSSRLRFCPVLSRVLASLVADPRASLPSISALTAAVTEFASTRHLDYATHLVGAPPTSPLAIGGDSALGCDALEDRQFELEFLADEGSPGIEPLAPLHSHSHTWCSRLTGPFHDEPFEPSGHYAKLVGCLMYLMTCTHPDLAFPLSIFARFVAPGRHRPVHWTAAVRVAKYLETTSGVGLVLGGRQSFVLTGHCNSSYADDAETHRSTQG
ncbi:unnamed protein product [Closterium sp. NIES-53]